MKIGISSYSFTKHMKNTGASYADICDIAKRVGFDGIEFTDLDTSHQAADSIEQLARDIRVHCDNIGLEIIAYTVSADFLSDSQETEKVMRKVDIAAILGVPVLRHDATWKMPEGMGWLEAIDVIKQPIRDVTVYAEKKGIRTCTENHGYFLQDALRVEALIKAVDHSNYGWLVDMGNFLCVDEPALYAMPIAAPYAFHAHAKDFLYKPAWEENPGQGWFPSRNGSYLRGTVVGHGVVPIPFCVNELKKSGYNGWLSYEFEGMEENLPAIEAGYQYLRKVVDSI